MQKITLNKKDILLPLSAFVLNCLVYYSGRFLSQNSIHHQLTTGLDDVIPFLPWTVIFYWGCVVFWAANYILGVKFDKGDGYRFIAAHFIGETICFVIFILFPTTMSRPAIAGNGVFERLLRLTYIADRPTNLFPSIHCFAAWLSWIAVRGNKRIPSWYQWVSFLLAVCVCVSTTTVKQHVILDVPAGILTAEAGYALAGLAEGIQRKRRPVAVKTSNKRE